jgi:hypothetical protein
MKNILQNFRGAEKGSVTIEFVIGLPMILVAMVFIFEFSSMFWAHHIATNNVRSATRFISRAPLTAAFLTDAQNMALTGDPTGTIGFYNWNDATCANGGPCVTITQNYANFTTAFRVPGQIIRVEEDIPFQIPGFGLVKAFTGSSSLPAVTCTPSQPAGVLLACLRIVEETEYFGQ